MLLLCLKERMFEVSCGNMNIEGNDHENYYMFTVYSIMVVKAHKMLKFKL